MGTKLRHKGRYSLLISFDSNIYSVQPNTPFQNLKHRKLGLLYKDLLPIHFQHKFIHSLSQRVGKQIFSTSCKRTTNIQLEIQLLSMEVRRFWTYLLRRPSFFANRTMQSSDSPIIRMAPQMAYTFEVPFIAPVLGSTFTMLICTEAWSLAWMIRLLVELLT